MTTEDADERDTAGEAHRRAAEMAADPSIGRTHEQVFEAARRALKKRGSDWHSVDDRDTLPDAAEVEVVAEALRRDAEMDADPSVKRTYEEVREAMRRALNDRT